MSTVLETQHGQTVNEPLGSIDHTPPGSRELLDGLTKIGFPLNSTLTELLDDDPYVRTNRFGGGFMLATSEIASFINQPRLSDSLKDLQLFEGGERRLSNLYEVARKAGIEGFSWRNLDDDVSLKVQATTVGDPRLRGILLKLIDEEALRQAKLRALPTQLQHEEARILGKMVVDIIHPRGDSDEIPTLPRAVDPKVVPSNCGSAEGYFHDWMGPGFESFQKVKPEIRMHVIIDNNGLPLMIEKDKMGASHFALTLRPFILNGVEIPPGSLVWLQHADKIIETGLLHSDRGSIRPAKHISGFLFSRLTPMALLPENRPSVFVHEVEMGPGFFPWSDLPIEAFVEAADAEVAIK